MSPLAHRWNVPGERLSHTDPEAPYFAPGPVSMRSSTPRLSTDVRTRTPNDAVVHVHDRQFTPVAVAPQAAPNTIDDSLFAAEFTGNGRRARNPLGHYTFYDGGSPEGIGWQEDRFIHSYGEAHREFYPGIEPTEGDTFNFVYADQRRNIPYDRPTSYGEQVSVDKEGALYQDLSATGGF